MENPINQEMIKNSIMFYKSRGFSEAEMISDIASVMHVPKDEIVRILKDIKK